MNKVLLLSAVVALLALARGLFSENRHEALFKQHPSDVPVYTNSGKLSHVPFHAYDAESHLIWGSADAKIIKQLLKDQDYFPITTTDGRGLMAFQTIGYANSTGGPYRELVVVIAVSHLPNIVVEATTAVQQYWNLFHPYHFMYVHRLWLNEQFPIEWGREFIALDKHKGKLSWETKDEVFSADVSEAGESVFKVSFAHPTPVQNLMLSLELAKCYGYQETSCILTFSFRFQVRFSKRNF